MPRATSKGSRNQCRALGLSIPTTWRNSLVGPAKLQVFAGKCNVMVSKFRALCGKEVVFSTQHTEASQHLVVCPVTFPPSFLITSQSIEFYWSLVLLFFHLGVAASAVSSFVTLRSFDCGGVRLDIYPFLLSYLPTCPLCLPLGQVKGFCFQPVVPQIISLVVYSLLTRLG